MTTETSTASELLEDAIGYLQEQKVTLSIENYADLLDYYGSMEAAQDILREAQGELD